MAILPSRRLLLAALALGALALSGCATGHAGSHSMGPGGYGPGPGPGAGSMDMQAMCNRHRQMMGSSTPAERQAMMQEGMKGMGMSAEDMQKRMQEMDQRCR